MGSPLKHPSPKITPGATNPYGKASYSSKDHVGHDKAYGLKHISLRYFNAVELHLVVLLEKTIALRVI